MIPYRTIQQLKRLAIILLVLLVVGAMAWALWFLWLQRFVVYTRDAGAVLDFSAETIPLSGQEAVESEEGMQVEIHYNEGENKVDVNAGMSKMKGYYVDAATLVEGPEAVWEQIQALPAGTAVMLDMKNIYGGFYYTTTAGVVQSSSVDPAQVDALLTKLRRSNYYTIARVPALRDREFALKDTSNGMPISGGYLWMDDDGCYWLNPTTQDTQLYLANIATELQELGFDEVLFDYFYFPDSDQIIFNQDKNQALANAAQTLVSACATDSFVVSFVNNNATWTIPTGNTRVYMDHVIDPLQISAILENLTLENPASELVFITGNMDTRYEEYGVLRPIHQAG